jgi:hypothetical protein
MFPLHVKKTGPQWPCGENGEDVAPAFLTRLDGSPPEVEMTLNLLDAYGIPYICDYQNNGSLDTVIMGYPTGGVKVYVPETMHEDARDVLNAEICEDEGANTDDG